MNTHPDPEQLSAYIDGELTGVDRDDLEQHLTGCSECSATLRGLRATVADMRALPSPVPSEQDLWALRSAISKARRRPAARYRRFVGAASGVAAVGIVIAVLSVIGHTTSSTFGRTSTGVYNQKQLAPQAAGSPPAILTDATNYNSTSAKSLLSSFGYAIPQAGPVEAASPPSTTHGVANGSESQTFSSADKATFGSQIATCERDIFSSGSGGARALAYIVGRYESTPAFFLIYSVVVSGKTKTEMWVVRQSDCYIRLFLAPQ